MDIYYTMIVLMLWCNASMDEAEREKQEEGKVLRTYMTGLVLIDTVHLSVVAISVWRVLGVSEQAFAMERAGCSGEGYGGGVYGALKHEVAVPCLMGFLVCVGALGMDLLRIVLLSSNRE